MCQVCGVAYLIIHVICHIESHSVCSAGLKFTIDIQTVVCLDKKIKGLYRPTVTTAGTTVVVSMVWSLMSDWCTVVWEIDKMSVSSSTAVFFLSLLGIPISYIVNTATVTNGPVGLFVSGCASLTVLCFLTYFAVRRKGHTTDPLFYGKLVAR